MWERIGAVGGVIRVRVLGSSEISIGRKRITPSAEVVFALGFYLCMRAGERLARDEVTSLLWGDGREAQSRHSLRQMLYRLRQQGFTLDEEGDHLFLDPARVDSDVARMYVETWPTVATREEVEAAAKLAPGFAPQLTPEYGEWLDGVRARVAAQHRRAALHQASQARREGRWADLDKWALDVLAADPLNEEATLSRAESAAMAGSKAYALEIIDQYLEELGDRSVRIGLPAALLRKRIAERMPEWPERLASAGELVGRSDILRLLAESTAQAASGSGGVVVLWGGAGIGKTAVAFESCRAAGLAGLRVITVRSAREGSQRPLSTAGDLICQLRDLPGAAGCGPEDLALLARATDVTTDPKRSTFVPPDTPAGRGSFSSALEDLFDAVTSEVRLVILIDDFHAIDPLSAELLAPLLAGARNSRCLWLLTSRTQRVATGDLLPTGTRFVRVGPLNDDAAVALARSLLDSAAAQLSDHRARTIAQASGGNPLFIRELAWHHRAFTQIDSLPTSISAVVQRRLQATSPDHVRVLQLLCLLGTCSTVHRVALALQRSPIELADALWQLESEGILTHRADGTLTLHDSWYDAVDEGIAGATRAALSLASGLALEQTCSSPDELRHAAHLILAGGDVQRASTLLTRSAETLLALGQVEEAAITLDKLLQEPQSSESRFSLLVKLTVVHFVSGRPDLVVARSTEALALTAGITMASRADVATLYCYRMDALTRLHQDHRQDLSTLAALASDQSLPPNARAFVCYTGIRTAFHGDSTELEELFFTQASALTGDPESALLASLVRLIYFAEHARRDDVRLIDAAISAIPSEVVPFAWQCRILRTRAMALRLVDDVETAIALFTRAFDLAESRHLGDEASIAAEALVFTHLDLDDCKSAETWILRWERWNSKEYALRTRALTHAKSRLAVQLGDFGSADRLCRSAEALWRQDLLGKRCAVDFATAAYCAASLRQRARANSLIQEAVSAVERNRASHQIDYAAEMALRALRATGRHESAQAFAQGYLRRRSRERPTALPSMATYLRRFASGAPGDPN